MCNLVATVGKSIYLRNVLQLSKFMVNFPSAIFDALSLIKCLAKERRKSAHSNIINNIWISFPFILWWCCLQLQQKIKKNVCCDSHMVWLWSLPNDAKMRKNSSSSSFEIDAKMNRSIYTHIKKTFDRKANMILHFCVALQVHLALVDITFIEFPFCMFYVCLVCFHYKLLYLWLTLASGVADIVSPDVVYYSQCSNLQSSFQQDEKKKKKTSGKNYTTFETLNLKCTIEHRHSQFLHSMKFSKDLRRSHKSHL